MARVNLDVIAAGLREHVSRVRDRESEIWTELRAMWAAQESRAEAEQQLRHVEDERERRLRAEIDGLLDVTSDEGMWP
ncbi:MAG: hypothetical protein M3680_14565 [Myxococcota bacterium]|nr:hypothetical protein [Myxococcota bacterium]